MGEVAVQTSGEACEEETVSFGPGTLELHPLVLSGTKRCNNVQLYFFTVDERDEWHDVLVEAKGGRPPKPQERVGVELTTLKLEKALTLDSASGSGSVKRKGSLSKQDSLQSDDVEVMFAL